MSLIGPSRHLMRGSAMSGVEVKADWKRWVHSVENDPKSDI